jgi:ketosteroid isomerase-like protein
MKRNILASLLIISSIFCLGQSDDKKAIHQILDEIATAQVKGDAAYLDQLYSGDFIFVNAQGRMNKTERVAFFKKNVPESFTFENVTIRIYGNTAVVNADVKVKLKGAELQTSYTTIVMVKMNGKWKEVNAQGTYSAPPK